MTAGEFEAKPCRANENLSLPRTHSPFSNTSVCQLHRLWVYVVESAGQDTGGGDVLDPVLIVLFICAFSRHLIQLNEFNHIRKAH